MLYLYVCVSMLVLVCRVCICLCVISNQSTSENHVIRVRPSVNLMPCSIKHIKVLLLLSYKACQVKVYNSIKENNTLDVLWSHIEPKKQGNKKSWGGAGQNLKKGGKQSVPHRDVFWYCLNGMGTQIQSLPSRKWYAQKTSGCGTGNIGGVFIKLQG